MFIMRLFAACHDICPHPKSLPCVSVIFVRAQLCVCKCTSPCTMHGGKGKATGCGWAAATDMKSNCIYSAFGTIISHILFAVCALADSSVWWRASGRHRSAGSHLQRAIHAAAATAAQKMNEFSVLRHDVLDLMHLQWTYPKNTLKTHGKTYLNRKKFPHTHATVHT